MKDSFLKKYGALIAASILFFALGFIYCAPSLQGKVVYAGDNINAVSAMHEGVQFAKETGDHSFWTGSMFSGMPNYQIGGGKFNSDNLIRPIQNFLLRGSNGQHPAWILIFYLFCFYFMLRSFDIDKWLAIAGAVAMTFSSYFLIIIAAGHLGKPVTISYISLVIGGFYLIFRKKYGIGVILTMFFTCMGFTKHVQMAYYMFMLIGMFWLAELYIHIREKRIKDLVIGTLLFAVSVGIGIGAKSSNMLANKEYLAETMRGGHSDLSQDEPGAQSDGGLSLDYATRYSYGIGESLSFMIPGAMGGASTVDLGKDSPLYKDLVKNGIDSRWAAQFCQSVPLYWGDQPFTAGNVYMGAVVCFLFVLGLIIVRGPYKWAIAAATLFSVMLAWGFHFMPLTEFFYNHFPMYNKFRAVSSILIVAEITMPLLGFLAVKELFDCMDGKNTVGKASITRGIYMAAGITAGICLILALFSGVFFDFKSPNDARIASQLPEFVYQGILDARKSLLVSDSLRSLLFIILTAALLWITQKGWIKKGWTVAALLVLVLADMWPVDQRYFNNDNFVSDRQKNDAFAMQTYEKQLLSDPDPNFRVMNLATNTFTDARTSYYLKSVGGYSAAKLRRYQDLIDRHLSQMHMPVLDMLNTKYFITKADDGSVQPMRNPNAMGNAWFVEKVQLVDDANQEIDALDKMDLHTTAVTDRSFEQYAAASAFAGPDAQVHLLSYTPKSLDYEYSAQSAGTIVFSEIYYPYGWKASIDGKPADHYRVNYVLRAMNVPAGNHSIHFEFDPDSVRTGNTIATTCILIMYAVILLVGIQCWRRRRSI